MSPHRFAPVFQNYEAELARLRAEIAALQRAIETTLADPLCDGWTLARLQNALGRSREATSSGAGAGEPPDGVRSASETLAGVPVDDLYGPVEK